MKPLIRQLIREEIRRLFEEQASVSEEDAQKLYNTMKLTVDFNEFVIGMNSELEHQDVTGGDLVKTAKIALAHLREVPDYYSKLKQYVEPDVQQEDDMVYDDGSGKRQKYSDQSGMTGGMGSMMS